MISEGDAREDYRIVEALVERFEGKVALVTGAAHPRGLGYHSAMRLASEGARVVLTDINAEQVAARAKELTAQGYNVLACGHDVAEPDAWEQVKCLALGRFSRIDIVVNNAGIVEPAGILDASLENWKRHIDINMTGVFLGCQIGGRQMREQGDGGTIINISSIAGQQAFPSLAAYVASKGGVRMLTKAAALDLADYNIRVNSVHPGNIHTEMLDRASQSAPELVQIGIAKIPMKRLGLPEDIAAMVAFLACEESSYITGAEFNVDGGMNAAA